MMHDDISGDALKDNEQMLRDWQEAQMKLARQVYTVFETPSGVELMETLKEWTIYASLLKASAPFGASEINMSPSDWAYFREGQNSIVRWLLENIELAKTPPTELQPKGIA